MSKFTSKTASEAGKRSKRGKSEKTKQWEMLGESIINEHTQRFNNLLRKATDEKFLTLFPQVLEYFKPKLNRTDLTNDGEKYDFSVYSNAELIDELRGIAELISGTKGKGEQAN